MVFCSRPKIHEPFEAGRGASLSIQVNFTTDNRLNRLFISENSGFFERADDDINQKYRRMRFYLGLPEGSKELESNGEGLLPLEANADLCGGVSFTKGCYVGQELTARSRYVGVIRRRVAPIILQSPSDDERLGSVLHVYPVHSVFLLALRLSVRILSSLWKSGRALL